VEVEGGADAHQHRRVEAAAHGGHPLLLLGDADADPHDVGARAIDLVRDVLLLARRKRAEGRSMAADDLQPGVARAQVVGELHERALVAPAVEEHARAGRRRALAGPGHQLGPIDAILQVGAEGVHGPHERLAVGHGEVAAHDRPAQLVVLAAGHDRVRGGDADVAALVARHGRVDPVQRGLVVDVRERHAEHVDGVRSAERGGREGGRGTRPGADR
jgi:hypothetical protein